MQPPIRRGGHERQGRRDYELNPEPWKLGTDRQMNPPPRIAALRRQEPPIRRRLPTGGGRKKKNLATFGGRPQKRGSGRQALANVRITKAIIRGVSKNDHLGAVEKGLHFTDI